MANSRFPGRDAALARRYQQGATMAILAAEAGRSRQQIQHILARLERRPSNGSA